MYTIVALAYLLTAGMPDEPLPFVSKHTFVGLDKCQDYMKSEAFLAERLSLQRTLAQAVASSTMSDGKPLVQSISITASCQEDNRV